MKDKSWFGKAEIKPKEDFIAGSLVTWKLTYFVGKSGIDDGGSIRISFRGDSERPQFDNPKGSEYTTVSTNADVRLIPRFGGKLHIRPWWAAVQIDIRDGSLKEADQIIIKFGDKSAGIFALDDYILIVIHSLFIWKKVIDLVFERNMIISLF